MARGVFEDDLCRRGDPRRIEQNSAKPSSPISSPHLLFFSFFIIIIKLIEQPTNQLTIYLYTHPQGARYVYMYLYVSICVYKKQKKQKKQPAVCFAFPAEAKINQSTICHFDIGFFFFLFSKQNKAKPASPFVRSFRINFYIRTYETAPPPLFFFFLFPVMDGIFYI